MKITTAGESHGKGIVAVIEGLPAGLEVDIDRIDRELLRRQSGFGRGDRQKIEQDRVEILSGVRNRRTTASPLALFIRNRDYENAKEYMSPEGCDETKNTIERPRPGHCDLAGMQKYSLGDARNVSERASARETCAHVAAGTIARGLLERLGVFVTGFVSSVGEVIDGGEYSFRQIEEERTALLCMMDKEKEREAVELIKRAKEEGETLGGVSEIRAKGLKSGFGSCMTLWEKLDAQLAFAVMGVQAVKGVEIGLGFQAATRMGSNAQDAIYLNGGKFYRKTNFAGGIEGGMSNGEEIVLRAAMKPLPSLGKGLPSVDVKKMAAATSERVRSDVCAVTACEVVLEGVVSEVLLSSVLARLGGDTAEEVQRRYEALP